MVFVVLMHFTGEKPVLPEELIFAFGETSLVACLLLANPYIVFIPLFLSLAITALSLTLSFSSLPPSLSPFLSKLRRASGSE